MQNEAWQSGTCRASQHYTKNTDICIFISTYYSYCGIMSLNKFREHDRFELVYNVWESYRREVEKNETFTFADSFLAPMHLINIDNVNHWL